MTRSILGIKSTDFFMIHVLLMGNYVVKGTVL